MNGTRAWQAPLFWVAVGSFVGLVGLPLLMCVLDGMLALSLVIDRTGSSAVSFAWATLIGLPLSFFLFLFADARGRIAWVLARVDRPRVRVLVLVLAAVIVAGWRTLFHLENLDPLRLAGEGGVRAISSAGEAAYTVGVAAPLVTGALLVGLRRGASNEAVTSPILWLSIGCFVSIVGFEVGMFMWTTALWAGGALHLGAMQIEALVWILTVASPPACVACAYAFIVRSRSPRGLLGGRRFALALGVGCVVGVGAWVSMPHVLYDAQKILAASLYDRAHDARTLAGIVAGCMMPVAAGALVLRLGHFARAASAAPSR
jgi:hypothetical protein